MIEDHRRQGCAYKDYKNITDKIYSGELTSGKAFTALIEVLAEYGIRLRGSDNKLLGFSFFVYDKGEWADRENKPLGLGAIYKKLDATGTQDIFFFHPNKKGVEKYYSEKELVKKYPWMKDVHKKNLPIMPSEND